MTIDIRHAFLVPSHRHKARRWRVVNAHNLEREARQRDKAEHHAQLLQMRADRDLRDPRDMRERQQFDAGKILPFFVT